MAIVEIGLDTFPPNAVYTAFSAEHLCDSLEDVEIGSPKLIVGYSLGFHDTLHHLTVARHAISASPLSFRFQGMSYFLTEARTHRGTSGACVVMTSREPEVALPWRLLGIHSPRPDLGIRDLELDDSES